MVDVNRLPGYLSEHIRQSLAEDPRTNTMDIEVQIIERKVILFGVVESEPRRGAVEQVIREVIPPTMQILNELRVLRFENHPDPEVLP